MEPNLILDSCVASKRIPPTPGFPLVGNSVQNSGKLLLGAFLESVSGDSWNVDRLERSEMKSELKSLQGNDPVYFRDSSKMRLHGRKGDSAGSEDSFLSKVSP